MKTIFFILGIVFLSTVPFSIEAFGQTTYNVNIPTGAANQYAPYFWQSEKDGSTTGIVEILIGDTITWRNADTSFHDVTSGSEIDGPDGIFISDPFGHGKSFSYTFDEIGHYPYYCSLHPWMIGTIIVTDGYSIIPDVDKSISDGDDFFDVEYNFNRAISNVDINQDAKSITFEIIGEAKTDNHELELKFLPGLIDGPFVIWVDGEKLSDFEHIQDDDGFNILFIPLESDSEMITITGTSIVPEFGSMVLLILGVSIVTMMILSQRVKLSA